MEVCQLCDQYGQMCEARLTESPGFWLCTRPLGHDGEHIACGAPDHDMKRWTNDSDTKLHEEPVQMVPRSEYDRQQQWINDLQAGMYINCVYCGHRYGPDDEVPATMADALKEHVEQCPDHPMSALKRRVERLEGLLREARNEAIADRDAMCEAVTNAAGFITDPLDGEALADVNDFIRRIDAELENGK